VRHVVDLPCAAEGGNVACRPMAAVSSWAHRRDRAVPLAAGV
jgi:hypothetical protein